jgi:protein-L-isoaspartate(D-aspartate) O-methyltransferase
MTTRPDRPRALLIWPGGLFSGGANFGVPQLLSMAGAMRRAGAEVTVVDLDLERAFGRVDLAAIARGPDGHGYDLVGVSCYSSYEYLKVLELGRRLRAALPKAWLVTGGYHASARPSEFEVPESAFDFVVIGDGEGPMARLASALSTGKRPLARLLGPASVEDVGALDPYDWSLLERYRGVARKVASQAEIYLSRGCPFDCQFCMERAKRDVSWRPLEPERALEELHALDRFLDLSRWTLFVADALFGMKKEWRRTLLEGLARRPIRAKKIWLLIRIDLLEEEDLALMARANVGAGFGLESGDPEQLKRIRKSGKLDGWMEQMERVAGWCHTHHVPFGANVIVGHPGETEATLRRSAAWLERLFLGDPRGTMGFLSVDPFRLYPGSPIDEDLDGWMARTGMKPHRYPWWHDGDPDFLAEWVDPSGELDFRRAHALRHELFRPILSQIEARFAYQGPARDYFLRAVREQVDLMRPRRELDTLGKWHLWRSLVESDDQSRTTRSLGLDFDRAPDPELADAARRARLAALARWKEPPRGRIAEALETVPREDFVRLEDLPLSADDRALALTDDGGSTISAMHAYARAFEALSLGEGDALVELGAGTGYGAALGAAIVGPSGRVLAIEIVPSLAAVATARLEGLGQVAVVAGDAHQTASWQGATKVNVGFAIEKVPEFWVEALADGGVLVAPVRDGGTQRLLRMEKRGGAVHATTLGEVRFVPDRAGGSAGEATVDEGAPGGGERVEGD